MEFYSENGFLEELIALKTDPLEDMLPIPMGLNEFYEELQTTRAEQNFCNINGWNDNTSLNENTIVIPQNTQFGDYNFQINETLNSSFGEFYTPEITDSSTHNKLETTSFLGSQEDFNSLPLMEDEEQGIVGNGLQSLEMEAPCKMETMQLGAAVPRFEMGISAERKNKSKKQNGQPSKNLMAERRRRKRLNDRLSMLRSVVPKISKMDRTSILGDTIDYMKELVERINNLQEEMDEEASNDKENLMNIIKDVKPNEVLVRNSPKFDVERRNMDTRIEICCAGKPGLLLSTMATIEALDLEIQQCVISCFNDFALRASCSEDLEQRGAITSEEIKQALFRNAGYGGRCL